LRAAAEEVDGELVEPCADGATLLEPTHALLDHRTPPVCLPVEPVAPVVRVLVLAARDHGLDSVTPEPRPDVRVTVTLVTSQAHRTAPRATTPLGDANRRGLVPCSPVCCPNAPHFHRNGAHADAGLGIYFSGEKGFHLSLVALPGFHPLVHVPAVVKLLCLTVAQNARVKVDPAIYDRQRLFRLPNTRHPRSGLYKRFLDTEELFQLDAARVRDLARHPAGFAVPTVCEDCEQLAADWIAAEGHATRRDADRSAGSTGSMGAPSAGSGAARREAPSFCPVVPDFVRRFIGFEEIQDPGRAVTLFRCAAALAEAETPPAVVRGLLEEPARKSGLDVAEVEKQLSAGIAHGQRAKGGAA
jgi:hypothetical protein